MTALAMNSIALVRYVVAGLLLLASVGYAADQRITLLHVNDVYQIAPVDKGRNGGLARLATIRDQVRATSPDTLLVFGGDTL
jgi:5'-nucleotidase